LLFQLHLSSFLLHTHLACLSSSLSTVVRYKLIIPICLTSRFNLGYNI
jgi:hypothetical protein